MLKSRIGILTAAQLVTFFCALLATRSTQSPVVWMASGLLENLMWILAYLLLRRNPGPRWRFISLVPFLFLLFIDWRSPFESDPFRYEWDGRALLAGINPWLTPPSSVEFAPDLQARMNFPELATIYSPFSVVLFSGSAWLGDLTSLGFLSALRIVLFASAAWSLRGIHLGWFWLMHPLLLREGFANAHPDVWLGALLLGVERVRHPLSSIGAALLAGLVKLPGLLVVLRSRRPLLSMGILALMMAGGWLALHSPNPASAHSLFRFGTEWEANSGWFRWIRDSLYQWISSASFEQASLYARGFTTAALLLLIMALLRKARHPLFWIYFLIPWLSPVANAWYFLWSFFLLAALPEIRLAHLTLLALLPLGDAQWLHQYAIARSAWPMTTWFRDHWGAAPLWNLEHLVITASIVACMIHAVRRRSLAVVE
jgi:hypothetical protein